MMITLIGESHYDLERPKRQAELLSRLKPDTIALEECSEDFLTMARLSDKMKDPKIITRAFERYKSENHAADHATFSVAMSSLSSQAIANYASNRLIPIVFCGNGEDIESINWDKETRNPRVRDDFGRFVSLPLEKALEEIEQEYAMHFYPVADLPRLVRFYQSMDEKAEKMLRQIEGKVAYFCGLDHIYGDYHPNLYDRLSDLKPERMKLDGSR